MISSCLLFIAVKVIIFRLLYIVSFSSFWAVRLTQCCISCLHSMHCYFQPSVRFEACRGLYRLSLIKENSCLIQLMDALLDSLPLAQSLQSRESSHARRQEPSAREYFSILCRLVDGLPSVEGGEKVLGLFIYSVLSRKSKQEFINVTDVKYI